MTTDAMFTTLACSSGPDLVSPIPTISSVSAYQYAADLVYKSNENGT